MKFTAGSYRHILQLAIPIIIGAIAQNVILATDALFMAGVDAVSLDAVGLGGLYYNTLFVLGFGFSTGVQILIARRHGEKNLPAIGQVFNSSLQILMAMSLLLWAVMEVFSPTLLRLIIHSEAVYGQTIAFLDQRAWGIVFAFFGLAFRSLYIGVSSALVITLTTIITAVANVFFNYALIFGHFGFPALGISGSGMASSIAEAIGAVSFVGYMWYKGSAKEFSLFRDMKLKEAVIRQVSRIASPVMFQFFLSHAGWFVFFLVIERLGEQALAISVIIRIIYMFEMVPFWGFNAAANTVVSYLIGSGAGSGVMPSLRKVFLLSFGSSLVLIIPNLFFPEWIVGLAAGKALDAGFIANSVPTLQVISCSLVLFAWSMTYFSGVTGSGNTRFALLAESITIAIYVLFAWYVGSRPGAKVHEVWLTEVLYFLLLGLVSYWYMASGRWRRGSGV